MSKTKKILPELRFPEFKNDGEWKEKKLGEFLIKNSTKNKKQKYSLVESVSNKFGFIKQDEYFENRRVASNDTSNYYVVKKGYFAYNPSRIDVGSLAYKYDDKISIISPLYVSFKANNDLVDDCFLLNFFNSVCFTKQMIFEGGVRNTLNYENLTQIKIPIPKLPEQQRVAACLSSLDELISAHSQKLELLKAHKKGLMQNLFPQEGEKVPKLRFPEFKNGGEWKEKELGEIAKFAKGKGISKSDVVENGILPCIRYGELYTHYKEIITDVFSFTNVPVEGLILSKVNDVIIPSSGETHEDIATASCVMKNGVALGGDLNVIRPKINGIFLSYYLNNAKKREIAQIAQGISVIHLYSNQLQCLKIAIPAKKEQQKIASCLSSLDELITAQSKKIEQLKQHKKGLMQGLFPKINEYNESI
ncbi:restriction endonuclease subunit S [Bacteroides heparinolyticus]|uniref:restriction endonuclease subunit S n=1 Tax=Prevotella heparinolytica TaxID=28113 RepID=UPI0035A11733